MQIGYYNETNQAREQALRLLKGSGKLTTLVEAAEKQLKRAPNSAPLMQALMEYYQAAGDAEKAAALSDRLLKKNDDDPQLRFQIAQQQAQQGEHEKANGQFSGRHQSRAETIGKRLLSHAELTAADKTH